MQLSNLHSQYSFEFKTIDQPVICGDIACVNNDPWLQEIAIFVIPENDIKDGLI